MGQGKHGLLPVLQNRAQAPTGNVWSHRQEDRKENREIESEVSELLLGRVVFHVPDNVRGAAILRRRGITGRQQRRRLIMPRHYEVRKRREPRALKNRSKAKTLRKRKAIRVLKIVKNTSKEIDNKGN